jgi:hypothetical protein
MKKHGKRRRKRNVKSWKNDKRKNVYDGNSKKWNDK